MNRLRFLGLLLASSALVGAVALESACSSDGSGASGSSSGSSGSSGASSGDLGGASAADIQALGKWCTDEQQRLIEEWSKDPTQPPPEFDHEMSGALITAAAGAYASGANDIALSPSKCTRLLVTREGGKVTAETLVRGPFTIDFDQAKGDIVYKPTSVARWAYTDEGERFAADYDGDGFDESRLEVVYGKKAVREEHAAGSDQIVERTTSTIAPEGGVVEAKTEQLVDGQLVVTRTVTAPMLQESCNPVQKKPPPPTPPKGAWEGPTRACTTQERDQISKLISTALQKGTGCLFAAGMRAQSDQVLKTYIRNEARFDCTDDAKLEMWAANESGYMNFFPGKIRLIFFSGLFSQSQGFQEGTVGHELFHFFDVHDPEMEKAATEDQLRMSDPVYACEYLCFGSKPTTCHLAACQQKKLSTGWKGKSCQGNLKQDDVYKIEKARGDGVSIQSCSGGFQVGALCRGNAQGDIQFCTTEAECNAACGSPCESKSLSCLPDCR